MKPFSSTFLQQDIYISHSSQSASDSILLSLQANITSNSNVSSSSSINKSKMFFEMLLAANIMHSNHNEIP